MIINKTYINSNYYYLKVNFNELVRANLSKASSSGRLNKNLSEDLIQLSYFLDVIIEYAKYYAYVIDQVEDAIYIYLAGSEDDGTLLESSGGLFLVYIDPNYDEAVTNDEELDVSTLVDDFIKSTKNLVTDIDINTNYSSAGFNSNTTTNNIDINYFQDELVGNEVTLNEIKTLTFLSAVKQANEIVYKYSKERYSTRDLEY